MYGSRFKDPIAADSVLFASVWFRHHAMDAYGQRDLIKEARSKEMCQILLDAACRTAAAGDVFRGPKLDVAALASFGVHDVSVVTSRVYARNRFEWTMGSARDIPSPSSHPEFA